ncbi:MAG: GtrA family protein [Panacagrimonas sp.]
MPTPADSDPRRRAARFVAVGLAATACHVVVASLSIEWAGLHPGLANGLAYVCATALSYVLNTTWTFGSQAGLANLLRFLSVTGAGGLLSVVLAGLAARYGYPYWSGIALVVMVVPALNYLGHRYWTYG